MVTNKNAATLDLKVGDVVRLKSGGPKMTVESIGGLIACMWFARGHAKHGFFDLDMLELTADAELLT
jgi:uncharacterized protein YodC (DUF2158 family)